MHMILAALRRSSGPSVMAGVAVASLLSGVGVAQHASAQALPSNPRQSCTVASSLFSTWFKSRTVTADGVVEPANSVTFPHQNNCQFYQWSEQMFLWLTSPSPPEYGGGNTRIYASPVFFGVSPANQDDVRHFIPNDPLGPFGPFGAGPIAIRTLQNGPGGNQVLFTKSGELVEVDPTPPAAKPIVRDAAGAKVVVAHARFANGVLALSSAANAPIQPQLHRESLTAEARAARTRDTIPTLKVKKFVVDGVPIFIDPFGNIVDVDLGQAGGGDVLQAQNGSLVYYTISTNDVYAYFLTGVAKQKINTGNQFPTNAAQLQQIVTYAKSRGVSFPDPTALTVEVKAAWVEAAGLANSASYLTMSATVPTYDKSNPQKWTVIPNKNRTVTLALVGMHLVGSVAGHPEMVWATFEHAANEPRGAYQYIDTSGATVTVPQQSGGPWVFAAVNARGPFNKAHMNVSGSDIVATADHRISPSDTIHWKAFGAAYATPPNPEDKTPAASNTEIISINNSVRGQLVGGDVRGNYILTGATWTQNGAPPNNSNQIGTSMLANSTMETYHQGANNADAGLNCFTCHAGSGGSVATTGVSHVFSSLDPLP